MCETLEGAVCAGCNAKRRIERSVMRGASFRPCDITISLASFLPIKLTSVNGFFIFCLLYLSSFFLFLPLYLSFSHTHTSYLPFFSLVCWCVCHVDGSEGEGETGLLSRVFLPPSFPPFPSLLLSCARSLLTYYFLTHSIRSLVCLSLFSSFGCGTSRRCLRSFHSPNARRLVSPPPISPSLPSLPPSSPSLPTSF